MDTKLLRYGAAALLLVVMTSYGVMQLLPSTPEPAVVLSERPAAPQAVGQPIENATPRQLSIDTPATPQDLRQALINTHTQQRTQDTQQTIARADQLIADTDRQLIAAGIAVPPQNAPSTPDLDLSVQQARLQALKQNLN